MSEPQRHTYGARFLRELKQRLQSTAGLKYAAIQALEGADREEFGRILRRELTGLPYAVNQMIVNDEPETVARWFAQELQNQAAANSSLPAFFF